MCGDVVHVRIDPTEEGNDTIHGGHGLLHVWQAFRLPTSVEEVHEHFNVAKQYY